MGIQASKFDPSRLALSTTEPPKSRPYPPAGRRRQEFLPEVDWSLFKRLAVLPGKAGWVALAIYRLARMRKSNKLMVNASELADELGFDRKSVSGGLKTLEQQGVLRCQSGRGSFATVELLMELYQ